MKKCIICLIAFAVIFVLVGCSVDNDAQNTTAKTTQEVETTQELKTTVGSLGKSITYALSENEAKDIAYRALKKECAKGTYNSIENFKYSKTVLYNTDEGCISFNRGYGNTSATENFTGHAYYAVSFEDTSQIAGFAYLCVDAVNGDVLFSGYMGD